MRPKLPPTALKNLEIHKVFLRFFALPAGALLPDYYVRSGADRLEDVPQIKAELQRIWSDYDFVRDRLTWEEVGKRIADYKRLDILA